MVDKAIVSADWLGEVREVLLIHLQKWLAAGITSSIAPIMVLSTGLVLGRVHRLRRSQFVCGVDLLS